MKKNMGNADRILRIVVAIILGVLYYNGTISGTWGIVAIVVAVVFALTSIINFCPLYSVFGMSTCKTKN